MTDNINIKIPPTFYNWTYRKEKRDVSISVTFSNVGEETKIEMVTCINKDAFNLTWNDDLYRYVYTSIATYVESLKQYENSSPPLTLNIEEIGEGTIERVSNHLMFNSYSANRSYGMTHEQLLFMGIGDDEMKLRYES